MPKRGRRNKTKFNTERRYRDASRAGEVRESHGSLRAIAAALSIVGSILTYAEFFGQDGSHAVNQDRATQAAAHGTVEWREKAAGSGVTPEFAIYAEFGSFRTYDAAAGALDYWRSSHPETVNLTAPYVAPDHTSYATTVYVLRSLETAYTDKIHNLCNLLNARGAACSIRVAK